MRILSVVFLLLICFTIPVQASQSVEEYYEKMIDETDDQTQQLLENFGIQNGSYDEILNIDYEKVVSEFLNLCRNEIKEPLKTALAAFVLLMILSIIISLASSDDSVRETISSIGTILLSFSLFVPVSDCMSSVLSACQGTSDFTKVLIPVLTGIVSVAGKPSLALCFQGFCFTTAQVLSSLCCTSLPIVCVTFTALSVCGSVSSVADTVKIAELIKKGFTMLLSFASALFSGLLSVKSVIAGCADTVAVKGVKFIVGNAVPVVGGALSDALNSVISGICMMKSTVGILAIVILVFINLPVLVELLMWSISLKLLNAAAGIMGMDNNCKLISAFEDLFKILGAVVIFQMFLYIISVALLIIISGMG